MKKNKFAQGTLEYIIILGVLIGVFVLIGRMLQPKVNRIYNQLKTGVNY